MRASRPAPRVEVEDASSPTIASPVTDEQRALLMHLARYIWWLSRSEAIHDPSRVLAQVMDIGDWDDVVVMERIFGREVLRSVVRSAKPGWFRPRSWAFWHYRLDLIGPDEEPPPLPRRSICV